MEEGFVDVRAALVADGEPPVRGQPGQRALHHPAMASQALAALDAPAGNADLDVAPPQGLPAAREIVGFVCVQRGGTAPRATAGPFERRDTVEQRLKDG